MLTTAAADLLTDRVLMTLRRRFQRRRSGYSEVPPNRRPMMIAWNSSVDVAIAEAKTSGKFVLLDFFSPT